MASLCVFCSSSDSIDPDGTYAGLRTLAEGLRDGGFVREAALGALTWGEQ